MCGCERYDLEGNIKKERGSKKGPIGEKLKKFFVYILDYEIY